MTISEWNTCLPNEYSLEGTGLMAAYGLLQGWRGEMQFGYFSTDFMDRLGSGSFDLFGNPPQILQFPAVATMWHRGDVKEGELMAESLYDAESLWEPTEDRKPLPLYAALVGKVGYRFVGRRRAPVVRNMARYWDPRTLTARSTTGELNWNAAAGVVRIDSPATQAVIGFLSTGPHKLDAVSLTSSTNFGAVYVTAMDGREPVRSARRLLVTAVGPARNTGMEYERTDAKSRLGLLWRLKSAGQGPALIEAVAGDLEIRSGHAAGMKAWTLDVTGRRVAPVPLTAKDGSLTLSMKPEYKTAYYEIAVE
jgi:hypothetical protein